MITTTEHHGGQAVEITIDINPTPLTASMATQGITFSYLDRHVGDNEEPISVWVAEFDDRRWILWAEPNRERPATDPRKWWLARSIFDQSVIVGEYFAPMAAVKAAAMLVESTSPEARAANEAGKFCAQGWVPHHDVRRCPGFHS